MNDLVLVGGGHAHAEVLRRWALAPLPGVALHLVTPEPLAPYSGSVPAWLAGEESSASISIDMAALARAAGATLHLDSVQALDPAARQLTLTRGTRLGWRHLSLNVGSTLEPPAPAGVRVLSMRPLGALRAAWDALRAELAVWPLDRPLRLAAVGGGAAGFETVLAVSARLRRERPGLRLQARLLSRGPLLPGLAPGAQRAAARALARAGIELQLGRSWTEAEAAGTDVMLWATGARAHAWQRDPARRGGLAVDAGGFLAIDRRLRSISHPDIFAVGDCAAWSPALPKAGVYAVRMGPVLSDNLRAACGAGAWREHEPQARVLALLATADGRAIAARGGLATEGRWVLAWKRHIDRAFLQRYRVADAPRPAPLDA
ncbi:FAD-dependent oxidoreductase [Piscinibacter sp. Jin2]|uniref:FAD-dependent oxidoreductase n=1 Tax=Aquariibacter lacus TaxID=2801332 RepID=A0A9X0XFZ2_9BURK|nr:FAD-dependent oxidoreductase [Piscinibacter lacus]MBL0718835.1 FAD-dependent oxidoreductase [Piscinibacter lacus]